MAPAALRVPTQLLTILFLAGSALLLFFIVLAGTKSDGNILNKWYWIVADTSSIKNSPYPVSRWSLYGICGYEKGSSLTKLGNFISCTKNKPAYPFDLKHDFGLQDTDVWSEFQTSKFYYLTRFQFPFYLIALTFTVVALFLTLFGGSFTGAGRANSFFILLSFVFSAIAASLSTAAYVEGRNVFQAHSVEAKIAPTLYGFAWAVVFMALLNVIFSFVITPSKTGNTSYKTKKTSKKSKNTKAKSGSYKFGINKKKTTEGTVVDNKDASSFVRA